MLRGLAVVACIDQRNAKRFAMVHDTISVAETIWEAARDRFPTNNVLKS